MALAAWGRQLLYRVRSGESNVSPTPNADGTYFAVEVDIPQKAVEKLAGNVRKNQLKKETGADMHLYTPKTKDEFAFVRLCGSSDQVESAFECVCDDVAVVDIRFARRMQVRSVLVAESRQVGWIKGTNGVRLEKIQKDTNAAVRIEPFTKEKETQNITITGTVMEVYEAFEKIRECLESYDPEKVKKPVKVVTAKEGETREDCLRRHSSAVSSVPERKASDASSGSTVIEEMALSDIQKQQSIEKEEHMNKSCSSEHMHCEFTIEARPILFACLLGRSQENITKIKESTAALIEIGPKDMSKEFQNVDIAGQVDDVLQAARTVKASFERFDLNHSASRKKIEEGSLDPRNVKQMKGRASLAITQKLVGYFVGKQHSNANRIRDETNVDQLYLDDSCGAECKVVNIVGNLDAVLSALDKSAGWIKNYRPKTERSEHQLLSQKRNDGAYARPQQYNNKAPMEQAKEKRNYHYNNTNPGIAKRTVPDSQRLQSRPQTVVYAKPKTPTAPNGTATAEAIPSGRASGIRQDVYQQQQTGRVPQAQARPQPQQLSGPVLVQQPLQSGDITPSYVLVQPISANGQEQIPMQQTFVLQAAPTNPQQPQQLLSTGAPMQVVQTIPAEALSSGLSQPQQSQVFYLQSVPTAKRPPPPPPPTQSIAHHPPFGFPHNKHKTA